MSRATALRMARAWCIDKGWTMVEVIRHNWGGWSWWLEARNQDGELVLVALGG